MKMFSWGLALVMVSHTVAAFAPQYYAIVLMFVGGWFSRQWGLATKEAEI